MYIYTHEGQSFDRNNVIMGTFQSNYGLQHFALLGMTWMILLWNYLWHWNDAFQHLSLRIESGTQIILGAFGDTFECLTLAWGGSFLSYHPAILYSIDLYYYQTITYLVSKPRGCMVFANNQGISEGGVYNIMWPSANHHQARFIKHIWPLRALFLRIMTKIQVSEIVKFLLSITLVHRNELCNGVHIYTVVIWYSSICVKGWEMLTAWRPNPEWWGASIVALYTGPPAFKL